MHFQLHHHLFSVGDWSTLSKDGCHSCCPHNIRATEFLEFFAPLRDERLVACCFYGLFGCLGRGLGCSPHIAIAAAIGVTGIASLLPSPRAIARISPPAWRLPPPRSPARRRRAHSAPHGSPHARLRYRAHTTSFNQPQSRLSFLTSAVSIRSTPYKLLSYLYSTCIVLVSYLYNLLSLFHSTLYYFSVNRSSSAVFSPFTIYILLSPFHLHGLVPTWSLRTACINFHVMLV